MGRVVLASWTDSYTGYGQHAAQLVRYFIERGKEVVVRPVKHSEKFGQIDPEVARRIVWEVQPERWELLLSPPTIAPTPGKATVYFTMWETTALRDATVHLLNRATLIVVPCRWNAETFKRSGVIKPIVKVPLGVDPAIFNPSQDIPALCTFGCAGRLAHGDVRKGVRAVMELFSTAFPTEGDVRLKVKAFADDHLPAVTDPRIEVVRDFFTDQQLADWMRSLTAFVSLARGEGWGLMQHQALACGRPLVAPLYGGLREFADEGNTFPVAYSEVDPEEANDYFQVGQWCKPDPASAMEAMRAVYHNQALARLKGQRGCRLALALNWERSCRDLSQAINGALRGAALP